MTKHTPGPWHVDGVHSEALHDICMTNPPPAEGSPVVLASVEYDEDRGTCPTLAEANANARLIAAAPDLLAAAMQLIEGAESENWDRYRGTDEPRTGIAELRAAIAKARP